MKKIRNFSYIAIFLLILCLLVLQLFLSNRLTVEGKRVEKIQAEIIRVEEENNYLKGQIAKVGCLAKLIQTADEKGFIKDPPVINLTGKVPVAVYPNH